MTTTSMHTDHDRHRRRYGKADDELVGWFSAAIGVKAQSYEASTSAFDPGRPHEARLRALASGGMSWFDRIAATLAQLTPEHRRIIALVYTPHAAPTWLQDALSPPWGGGSFVQIATALPRATVAAQDRHRDVTWPERRRGVVRVQPQDGRTVLDWLVARGRRAKDVLLTSLREDAEALRMPAIAAYDVLRIARIKAEQVADKEAVERRSERNLALYSELVGKKRRKERERRAKRTGIAA